MVGEHEILTLAMGLACIAPGVYKRRDLAADWMDYETVMAINRIGKTTGKKTITEFVEDEKAVDLLREIGVDYGQSYFFVRPRRLEELLQELQALPR